MATCPVCGTEVVAPVAFCTTCGAPVQPQSAPRTAGPGTGSAAPGEYLVWERKIPLITNPYLVLQCLVIPIGIGIFLGLLFQVITGESMMVTMFMLIGGVLAIIFILVLFFLQITTGGGLLTTFFISSEGVAHKAGRTIRNPDRAATAGSILLGSMGGTGAGLIAMSQEFNTLRWKDVRYVSVYRSVRSVVLRSQYLISPVVLYCTEENFETVLTMVKKYAPYGAA